MRKTSGVVILEIEEELSATRNQEIVAKALSRLAAKFSSRIWSARCIQGEKS